MAQTSVENAPQPLCFITAAADGVVRNDYIENYAQLATNDLNEYHVIADADHTNICFDDNYASHMIRATINFLDKVVVEKETETAYRNLQNL